MPNVSGTYSTYNATFTPTTSSLAVTSSTSVFSASSSSYPTNNLTTETVTVTSSSADSSAPSSSSTTDSFTISSSIYVSSTSTISESSTSNSLTTSSPVITSSTITSSSTSESSTSSTSSSALPISTFYLQASDVSLTYTPEEPDEDPNLYRSNGLYAKLYMPYSSEYLTFAAADREPPAATFFIDDDSHLVHAENGRILNTYPSYLSNQVYFDENPYEDGYAPPACEIDLSDLTLDCQIRRQTFFSICFGDDSQSLGSNGRLYMTGNPIGQGSQCRAVTLNVRPI